MSDVCVDCTAFSVPDEPNIMDDMPMVKVLPKGIPYSQFNALHRKAAKELCQQFMKPGK